jgi:hypothetical protein
MFLKCKPNGEIRLLADHVPFNKITVKDYGPILNEALILRTLGRVKYYSTRDLANWYFQIRVEPKCEKYKAIKLPFGSFVYKVMLQGNTNVLATAMQVIEYILQGFIGNFMWAYLDDISIYSDTLANHTSHIQAVCQYLQDHNIIALPMKCNFFGKRLNFLGHYINEKGVHTDIEKIRGIQDWPTPKSRKEL